MGGDFRSSSTTSGTRLRREADQRRTSVAALIRGAIDIALLATDDQRRGAAVRAILDAAPMPVPHDPNDVRREVDRARVSIAE